MPPHSKSLDVSFFLLLVLVSSIALVLDAKDLRVTDEDEPQINSALKSDIAHIRRFLRPFLFTFSEPSKEVIELSVEVKDADLSPMIKVRATLSVEAIETSEGTVKFELEGRVVVSYPQLDVHPIIFTGKVFSTGEQVYVEWMGQHYQLPFEISFFAGNVALGSIHFFQSLFLDPPEAPGSAQNGSLVPAWVDYLELYDSFFTGVNETSFSLDHKALLELFEFYKEDFSASLKASGQVPFADMVTEIYHEFFQSLDQSTITLKSKGVDTQVTASLHFSVPPHLPIIGNPVRTEEFTTLFQWNKTYSPPTATFAKPDRVLPYSELLASFNSVASVRDQSTDAVFSRDVNLLSKMSSKDLMAILKSKGVSCHKCLDKEDLIKAVFDARDMPILKRVDPAYTPSSHKPVFSKEGGSGAPSPSSGSASSNAFGEFLSSHDMSDLQSTLATLGITSIAHLKVYDSKEELASDVGTALTKPELTRLWKAVTSSPSPTPAPRAPPSSRSSSRFPTPSPSQKATNSPPTPSTLEEEKAVSKLGQVDSVKRLTFCRRFWSTKSILVESINDITQGLTALICKWDFARVESAHCKANECTMPMFFRDPLTSSHHTDAGDIDTAKGGETIAHFKVTVFRVTSCRIEFDLKATFSWPDPWKGRDSLMPAIVSKWNAIPHSETKVELTSSMSFLQRYSHSTSCSALEDFSLAEKSLRHIVATFGEEVTAFHRFFIIESGHPEAIPRSLL